MRYLLAAIALMLFTLPAARAQQTDSVIVAGGCFWCVEADFDKVEGVIETTSGYAGGTVENPTYKQVVREDTGHKEVVRITYDPAIVGLDQLLHVFLRSIDVTDAGGQFCDRGDSYATAIFPHDADQEAAAKAAVAQAEAALGQPVVTEIRGPVTFYPAEDYHQDYYKKNPLRYSAYRQGCRRDARVKALWGDDAPFAKGS